MISADFFYHSPKAAYLLFLAVPILFLFFWLWMRNKKKLIDFASGEILKKNINPRTISLYRIKTLCICLAWLSLVFALMDPMKKSGYPENTVSNQPVNPNSQNKLKRKPHEVIFLIDTSASMNVKDAKNGSRLDYAKDLADKIVAGISGDDISLYLFTSQTDKTVPSTSDYFFMRLMMRNIAVDSEGVGGTDIFQALKKVMEDYPIIPEEKIKTLIIVSDGGDLHYEDNQTNKEEYKKALVKLLGEVKNKNLHVYTIGLGSEEGGKIPDITFQGQPVSSHIIPDLLSELADKGNGIYYSGNEYDTATLAKELTEKIKSADRFLTEYEINTRVYNDAIGQDFLFKRYYQYPLFCAVFFLILFLVLPDNFKKEHFL